jgi:Ca-activated chloride channel family protein
MSFLAYEYAWLFVILAFVLIYYKEKFSLSSFGYSLSIVFVILALMRPVIEQEPVELDEHYNDVVIAVDLSYSMQATDISPTRLEKAKEVLAQLIEQNPKTRFGVLGFTTNAIVLSPLTSDKELLLHLVNSLDTQQLMTKGSSLMPALQLARKLSSSERLSVVVLSDGADESEYDLEAKFAAQNNMQVNVLMLATKMGGTLHLEDGTLLKDELGDIVVSRENSAIKSITRDGVYTKDIDEIDSALKSQKDALVKVRQKVVQNEELFYYFVGIAIVLLLITLTRLKKLLKPLFIVITLFFGMQVQAGLFDSYIASEGVKAYESAEYNSSIKQFSKLEGDVALYNLACSEYKAGLYEKALEHFRTVRSDDVGFKADVFYNIGNTLVRLGEFKKARTAYLQSLTLMYSKEADENYHFIKNATESQEMITGQQKTKNKSELANEQESSSKKKKEGGGANMDVSAQAGSSGDAKKKTRSESVFDVSQAKAKLSSKQYELINKRQVNEKKPW